MVTDKTAVRPKEQSFIGKVLYTFLRLAIMPLARLIWVKKIDGLENMPKNGPYIIAANHQSYLDFICLASCWPSRIYFLAAEKFFDSPFWRPLVEYTGQIRVDRNVKDKSASLKVAAEYLNEGKIIVIFPQGTRSRDGLIGKAFTGVARLAAASGAVVLPVGISGAFELLPPHKKMPAFKKQIGIHIGGPISSANGKNEEIYYRVETDRIMASVAGLAGLEYKSA